MCLSLLLLLLLLCKALQAAKLYNYLLIQMFLELLLRHLNATEKVTGYQFFFATSSRSFVSFIMPTRIVHRCVYFAILLFSQTKSVRGLATAEVFQLVEFRAKEFKRRICD